MNWIEKLLVSKFVKGWLDKLPLSGWKTVLGVVIFIAAEVAKLSPEYGPIINWVVELIRPYADTFSDVGIAAIITGAIHKIAKWIEAKRK